MAYTTHPTVVTGQTWTAAAHNLYIKDNFDAIWQGTAAGDMDYYTSPTAKMRIGIGSPGQVMTVNPAGTAPVWGGAGLQYTIVSHSVTQSLPNGTATTLLFNTDAADPHNWHSTTTNTERITVTASGVYVAACYLRYTGAPGDGTYYYDTLSLLVNGVMRRDYRATWHKDAFDKFFSVTYAPVPLAAGDYMTLTLEQFSGGARSLHSGAVFAAIRIA